MLKIENYVLPSGEQWEIIIEGMRNPMNSWDKSDSHWEWWEDPSPINPNDEIRFSVGENDYELMVKLARAGSDHAKYLRMIPVYVTITAPLYWWKEFDTYKVGTVANSCSTMHKIHAKEFTIDDFSHENLYGGALVNLEGTIRCLNFHRVLYVDTHDKSDWDQIIQLLPSSYNQRRTVFLNYAVLANIYPARRNHKLTEWHTFCDFIRELPHSELITREATRPCTTSN